MSKQKASQVKAKVQSTAQAPAFNVQGIFDIIDRVMRILDHPIIKPIVSLVMRTIGLGAERPQRQPEKLTQGVPITQEEYEEIMRKRKQRETR